ncbi:hypothetical protein DCAR_0935974 [Daucus carota subsp. sativus]|uniref:Uncharacterized protein n=2 Tax=Daucus carota subsp. sativus TaxID=79200 RepID=A0AAF0XY33_DAUCS|nr:PREDICTED: transcription termination factor MTEF1, chloroplastic-like [Daucus carota subsp. sativus]WOH16421.1 hypothetical protein DCAR_0935974 [Daucus carota subsp. sativus]
MLTLQTQTFFPLILNPSKTLIPKFKTLNYSQSPGQIPIPTSNSGLRFHDKLLYLKTLNVNPQKALQQNPNFRSTPLESLKLVENCLLSMGIERGAFGRIFDMHPQLLSCDPYFDLYPVFGFLLNEVKIPFVDIRKAVVRCPRLLVCDVDEKLRPTLRFLRNLGFVRMNAVSCQTTLLLVSSVEVTIMPKLDYLMSLGFEYDEVARMVVRSPALLTYSVANNLMPKIEYFLSVMNGDLGELKRFPQFFSFSLEGKIKRRHRLLAERGLTMPLSEMLKISDGEFNNRLIEMKLRLLSRR